LLTKKYIILGLVAIAFVAGSSGIGYSFAVPNGTPFLQEEIDAIIEIIQELQDQLDNIHVDWVSVTDKPAGFADDIDNDTLSFMDCTIDQIVKWNGNQWVCTDSASDSLAGDFALRKVDCNIIGDLLDLSIQFDTMNGCNLVEVEFDDIEIPSANLSLADLTDATFDEADLTNADFSGANLSGVDFYGTDISDVNFSGAIVNDADFSRAINQPTGPIDCIGTPIGATFTCTG